MKQNPLEFKDVINCWRTADQLAADIGEAEVTVRAWRNRNSIPSAVWTKVINAANKRGLNITLDLLAKIASRRRKASD